MTIPTNTLERHDANALQIEVDDGAVNQAWDSFLDGLDSNLHLQSSLWGQVKTYNGWSSKRLIARRSGQIVGGAQLLVRNVRYLGRVGYIPKGPVLLEEDDALATALLERIQALTKSDRIRVLFIQPNKPGCVVDRLGVHGYRPCPVETAPSATLLVDVAGTDAEILSRMPKGMRNQIRRGQNRGIAVRLGTKADLPAFHQLLLATSQRRGFTTFDLEYFEQMWDVFEPSGGIQLFIAELEGEAVSAQFCIPFGDTVIAKQIGWSGKHSKLHPNEALDWFTIKWVKENGYRYYDLEGIERPAAKALLKGEPLPDQYQNSPTNYKRRLGGEVSLNPEAFCFVVNPLLRTFYNRFGFQMANWPFIQKAAGRFRTA